MYSGSAQGVVERVINVRYYYYYYYYKVIGEFQQAKNSRLLVPEIEKTFHQQFFKFTLLDSLL